LEEESVVKGRDFSNTEQKFINDTGFEKFKKPASGPNKGYNQPMQGGYNNNMYQPPMMPGNYPNVMMPSNNPMAGGYGYNPYGQAPTNYQNPNMGYYYPPPQGY